MRALSSAEVLALWEDGQRLHSLDRGLLAIRVFGLESEGDAADWPLGRRNQALAEMYRECFGPKLQGWTECGHCAEKLEFEIDCLSLIERQNHANADPVFVRGGAFRAPTSRDLARVAHEPDSESAARLLMQSCRLLGDGSEDSVPTAGWTPIDCEELGMRVAEADPLVEILLSFECPACKTAREQALDLPEFIWAQLEGVAKRILHEIHILAGAYGWSEDQILALSDSRRSLYLQMVQA